MRGCRGVEELAVTFLAMAVCALSLAWRLPVGVRTEVRVLEALRHAAFAWLPTGHCECDLCVPSAGGHAAEWLDGRVSPCFGVSCVQLGSAAHASHAAHRVIQGTGAELKDYDNVLTLPKLGAHGQLENAAHSSSHLVKLGAERAAQDVDSYFASLEKQVRFPQRAIAAVHLFTFHAGVRAGDSRPDRQAKVQRTAAFPSQTASRRHCRSLLLLLRRGYEGGDCSCKGARGLLLLRCCHRLAISGGRREGYHV